MTARAISMAALCVAVSVAACGPGTSLNTDTCPGGATGLDIDTLSFVFKRDGVNVQIRDGDVVPLTYGAQGGQMLLLGLSVTGRDIPDCVVQQTIAETPSGRLLDDEFRSMSMGQDLDGAWVTGQIILTLPGSVSLGDAIVLHGAMSGLFVDRYIFAEEAGTPPRPDAGPRSDAGPADAGTPDAN